MNLEAIDALLKEFSRPEETMGRGGLVEQLTKALVERALKEKLSHHLGYAKGEDRKEGMDGEVDGNCRNGYSKKSLIGESGAIEIEIPRNRVSSFEPQLIRKGQRRFAEFDEKIIAMYGR